MGNFIHFLDSTVDVSSAYTYSYDMAYVLLSFLIAMFAAFIALKLSGEVVHLKSRLVGKIVWLIPGALSLGAGVWAMHFIAMLALRLPCSVSYDPWLTVISMVPSVLASAVALWIIGRTEISVLKLVMGGVVIGTGICVMHYSGMAAMRPAGTAIYYAPTMFALSVVFSIILAILSLQVKFTSSVHTDRVSKTVQISVATVMMAIAISGTHYLSMEAAYFIPVKNSLSYTEGGPDNLLTVSITIAVILISALTFSAIMLKRNLKLIHALKNIIKEHHLLNKELEKNKYSLAKAQHIAHMGNWDWDLLADTFTWSDETYRIFGYMPQEFAATFQDFERGVHPDDLGVLEAALSEALLGKPFNIEHRIVLPSGAVRVVLEQGKVRFDENQKAIHMTGTIQDKTEISQLQTQILSAQKFESLAHLSANIAHEVNNGLTLVQGYIGLAKDELLTENEGRETATRYLTDALEGVKETSKIMREVLYLSHKTDLNMQVFNGAALVESMVVLIKSLTLNTIVLKLDIRDKDSQINVDKKLLSQVIINLTINAQDAMMSVPRGSKQNILTLGCYRVAEKMIVQADGTLYNGPLFAIYVADNGPGMSEGVQGRIFEPFYTTKPEYKGTGLGLSMVFSTLQTFKGIVEVESQVEKGARFTLFLPAILK